MSFPRFQGLGEIEESQGERITRRPQRVKREVQARSLAGLKASSVST